VGTKARKKLLGVALRGETVSVVSMRASTRNVNDDETSSL
jgi:hypothetical protein